jgi:hypothetical protein
MIWVFIMKGTVVAKCQLDTPKLWRHSLIWFVAISIVEIHTGDLKIPTRKKWESNLLSSKTLSSCPSGIECGQIDSICCCQIESKMFCWHQQKLLESWEKNVMSLSVSGSIGTHLCATNSAWKLSNVDHLQVQRKRENHETSSDDDAVLKEVKIRE